MPEQGELIRIDGISPLLFVASKTRFNKSGMAALCVVVKEASDDALHVIVNTYRHEQYTVLCETLKMIDVSKRGYTSVDSAVMTDVIEATDTIQSIFDY